MRILGIESSCDETAASVVVDGRKVLSSVVASSLNLHQQFGGVVPEIAARSHIEVITSVIEEAMKRAKCDWPDIDTLAVTEGPGLGGSLLVGLQSAKTISVIKHIRLYGINHVQAHVAAAFLSENQPTYPILALIVSGGHTQIVKFKSFFDYELLGKTRDDAVGEAFDKVAKMLGLPYPGGPSISKIAKNGNSNRYKFTKPKLDNPYDFSFSGLKTAVLRTAQKEIGGDYNFPSHLLSNRLTDTQIANLAASFQQIAIQILIDALVDATNNEDYSSIVIAGGVASNEELRRQATQKLNKKIFYPDPSFCTDNGAMIAAAGYFAHQSGIDPDNSYTLDIMPQMMM